MGTPASVRGNGPDPARPGPTADPAGLRDSAAPTDPTDPAGLAPADPAAPAGHPAVRRRSAVGVGAGAGAARSTAARASHRRLPAGTWLWPGLLAFVLGLYGAGGPQLWEDELNSWDMATRSTGRLLETLQNVDAVLAAYYLLLHTWTALFGDSDLALRLPSVLAAAGAAVCTALIGARLAGPRAGRVAGLLFALTPVVSRYAQEARPYALVVLAVALATLLLLRALDRPDGKGRWAAYALALSAVGLLHLVALTALAGHVVAAAVAAKGIKGIKGVKGVKGVKGCPVLLYFGAAVLTGTAAAAPVLALGRSQAGRQISWIPSPDLWGLAAFWPQLFGSALTGGAVMALAALAWTGRQGRASRTAGAGAGAGVGADADGGDARSDSDSDSGSGPGSGFRSGSGPGSGPGPGSGLWSGFGSGFGSSPSAGAGADRAWLSAMTASAVAPPLILWAVSHGDVSYFYFRYLLFTLPAWAVLAGAALRTVRPRAVLAVLLAGLALLTLPEQRALREPYAHFWHGVDYRGAAAAIEKYHRPGDAVVYDRGDDYWRLLDAGVRHYLPDGLRPRDVFLARSAADRADLWASECPVPARCLRDEPRIWLVVPAGEADPLQALPPAQARALRAHYTATGTERLTGVTVALLVRKTGRTAEVAGERTGEEER
ncbi:glycosyltransferase family 39 protein [Streptomyces roseicoloratus]|uniref:Glycosyltransferase family 39 protein n=1 Tax=Streptomyces roseicoloratus TaxID=2508722 RepID=A0ABY9RY14_9ACTN|nr:glycosyltransferase family 39 protein [Streptomyces roseicoloratus]WMX46573.1 glycosyltransferase family 39 protein [Streptomyces roseicoloratus]